jgi:hypothetical protein
VQTGASFERVDLAGATWVIATAPWSAQHTDKGSPGAAFSAPLPTPTPTAATTPELPLTATPLPFPTPTPTAGPAPRIRVSEVMADPLAIADNVGEFIELANPTPSRQPARLDAGRWRRSAPHDCRRPVARSRRVLRPHARRCYRARRLRASDYQFTSLQLGNTSGGIALYPPGGARRRAGRRCTWGDGAPLTVQPGASFERVDLLTDCLDARCYALEFCPHRQRLARRGLLRRVAAPPTTHQRLQHRRPR